MVAMVSWPTVNDDDGTLTVGTPWSSAVAAAIKASVEDQVHSATNPTLKPYQTTDEVVDARGSEASLGAWTLVEHNADGSHVATPQLSIPQNLLDDSLLNNWHAGDTTPPDGWTLNGAGAAIVRCGVGAGAGETATPADNTKMAWGDFCKKITYGAALAYTQKTIIVAADFPDGLQGRKITFAMRCTTSTASIARVAIYDGVGWATATTHIGDGVEAWVYTTITLDAAATTLLLQCQVAGAGSAYFGAGVLVQGEWTPDVWFSEPMDKHILSIWSAGNAAVVGTVNGQLQCLPAAGVAREFIIRCGTAPTGAALIYTPQTAAVMFATPPQVDATEYDNLTTGVGDRPDGTYANRCFARGDYYFTGCSQVGAGVTGANVDLKLVVECPKSVMDILVL